MGPNWAKVVASGDDGISHARPSNPTCSRSVHGRSVHDENRPLTMDEAELLATSCYVESIAVAKINGFSTIAFPLLASTGSGDECDGGDGEINQAAGTPSHLASIALSSIIDHVHTAPGLSEVHIVARDDPELEAILGSPLVVRPTSETACNDAELLADTSVLKTVTKDSMAAATSAPW